MTTDSSDDLLGASSPVTAEKLTDLQVQLREATAKEAWPEVRATVVIICEIQLQCARRIWRAVQLLRVELGSQPRPETKFTIIKGVAGAMEEAAEKLCARVAGKQADAGLHLPLEFSEQNNRLTAFLGFCSLLSNRTREDEVLECLARIQKESEGLIALLKIALREIRRPALEKLGWWNVPD